MTRARSHLDIKVLTVRRTDEQKLQKKRIHNQILRIKDKIKKFLKVTQNVEVKVNELPNDEYETQIKVEVPRTKDLYVLKQIQRSSASSR